MRWFVLAILICRLIANFYQMLNDDDGIVISMRLGVLVLLAAGTSWYCLYSGLF